jgi:hypothetical protein
MRGGGTETQREEGRKIRKFRVGWEERERDR